MSSILGAWVRTEREGGGVCALAMAALFLPMDRVFYSLVGAITMNLFVAWNHRYEWYIAR